MVHFEIRGVSGLSRCWFVVSWHSHYDQLNVIYAESHLLQPYPTSSGEIMDEPNLPAAQEALELHLARHESMSNLVEGGGQGMENAMHYLRFFGKSWAGLIRSRGW